VVTRSAAHGAFEPLLLGPRDAQSWSTSGSALTRAGPEPLLGGRTGGLPGPGRCPTERGASPTRQRVDRARCGGRADRRRSAPRARPSRRGAFWWGARRRPRDQGTQRAHPSRVGRTGTPSRCLGQRWFHRGRGRAHPAQRDEPAHRVFGGRARSASAVFGPTALDVGGARCAGDIGLATFMAAAGIVCSQRLGDVVAHLDPGDEARAVALLGGA